MPKYTLQLKWPFGNTIGLALIILVLLVGLAEIAARTEIIHSFLPAPSIGSGNDLLDLKLDYLNSFVKRKGTVDCIFLGGSAVHCAIDPEIFNREYKKKTGKNIRCFNFGVNGLVSPAAAILAKILTKIYKPRLIIWGTIPPAYSDKFETKTLMQLKNSPWVQYHQGNFSIKGWLTNYSFAYRYYLMFRFWMEYPKFSKVLWDKESRLSYNGYRNLKKNIKVKKIKRDLRFEPKPKKKAKFIKTMANFKASLNHLNALDRMIELQSQAEIVIIEMPTYPSIFSSFGGKAKYPLQIIEEINYRTKRRGVLFIPAPYHLLVPDKYWRDLSHMRHPGAKVLSEWLGKQIGEAVKKGLIKDPFIKRL